MRKMIVDVSMAGLDGSPRVYKSTMPSITARDYKEPRSVLEISKINLTDMEKTECLTEQSRAEQSRAA